MQEDAPGALCHLAAGQARHDFAPALPANLPAEHAAQVLLSAAPESALNRPTGQGAHDSAPLALCHLPAGQSTHALEPVLAANRPGGQSVQVALELLKLDVGPNLPAAHGVPLHGCLPVREYVPAEQFEAAVGCAAPQVQP